MTKDWESIRHEACRLYLDEGVPLEHIRAIFKPRGFDACLRSWRSRLNRWDVRRHRKRKVRDQKKTARITELPASARSENAPSSGPRSQSISSTALNTTEQQQQQSSRLALPRLFPREQSLPLFTTEQQQQQTLQNQDHRPLTSPPILPQQLSNVSGKDIPAPWEASGQQRRMLDKRGMLLDRQRLAQSPPRLRVWSADRSACERDHVSHACSCRADDLESRLWELVRCFRNGNDSPAMPTWLFAHLSRAKTDNILHLLVRDTKWSRLRDFNQVLTSLLGYMNRSDLNVDVTDCEGRRALELSIRTDNLEAMKLLLDHGAELGLDCLHDDGFEISPPDLAMDKSDDLSLIVELMRRTRKAQGLQAESALDLHCFARTLHRLDLTIASSTREVELQDAYIVLEQIALCLNDYFDGGFDWEGDELKEVLRILLKNWESRQLSISELDGRKWAHDCLERTVKNYLEYYDPLEEWDGQLWEGRSRDGCTCESRVQFAIFHVQDELVTDTVIRQLTNRHVDDFLVAIVSDCLARHRLCDAKHLCGLLRSVVDQHSKFDFQSAVERVMLETSDDLKPAFSAILVNRSTQDFHDKGGIATIADLLVATGEPYRWKMAEKVLQHDPGFPLSTENRGEAIVFHRSPNIHPRLYRSMAYLDHLCHWVSWECKAFDLALDKAKIRGHDWIADAPCGCHKFIIDNEDEWENHWRCLVWQYQARNARQMQRCVIHVITKDLCNQNSLFAKDMPLNERIRSALELRQEFDLPNLEIEQSLLLEAIHTLASQLRIAEVQSETMELDLFGPSPAPQDEGERNAALSV